MNSNDVGSLAMGLMESLDEVAAERGLTDLDVDHVVIVLAYKGRMPDDHTYHAIRYRASSAEFWTTRGLLIEAADMVSLVTQ